MEKFSDFMRRNQTENRPLEFLKELGQGSARAYAGTASGLVSIGRRVQAALDPTATYQDYQERLGTFALKPRGKFQESIYGTDQPITPASVGAEFGLDEKGKFAPAVGFLAGAIDVVPGGAGARRTITELGDDVVESILKSNKITEIRDILARSTDLDEKVIRDVAPMFKNVTTKKGFTNTVGKLKERGFIQSVRETLPADNTAKIAGQYIPRSTDRLAIQAKNLVKNDINVAEQVVKNQADEVAVATASELIKKYTDDAIAASQRGAKQEADLLYDKVAEITNTIAPKLTELGRAVQAASIIGRLTPEGQVRFAARQIENYNKVSKRKIPELTKEQTQAIVEEMDAINKMPDSWEKAARFQKLQEDTLALIPTPLMKKLVTVWKAGLLTGIKTTGLNLFSNASHFATEMIKDVPAVIVDRAASLFTGERSKTLTFMGTGKGIEEGFNKGVRYFKTGFDERNIGEKLDYRKVNFGKGEVAQFFQKYTDIVFRSLGSQDQPFYYGTLSRSLYDQALARGINKGLTGKELRDYAKFIVEDPDIDMMTAGILDATTAVFQNKTKLSEAGQAIRNAPGSVGEIIIPFNRTPSAVAMQIINYSPVGAVATIWRNVGKGKFNQRDFAQGMGRAITGTAPLALGAHMFANDMVTLDYPSTERERQLWEAEGRKANTINIDGNWRNPIVLGPAGNLILIGAHFQNALKNSGSPTEAMYNMLGGSFSSFLQQTFLTGVNAFVQAIEDPKRNLESFLAGLISSTIPTIVSDAARAIDPFERRTDGIVERTQARIPVLREDLEPRVTPEGEQKERVGSFMEVMFDPTRPSPVKDHPVTKELRRLWDNDHKVVPTQLGDRTGFDGLTPEENTQIWEDAGQLVFNKLEALVAHPSYKGLSDDEKADKIEEFTKKAQRDARAMMVIQLTDGLSGEALSARLAELKAGGLLTREVFYRYQELR